MTTALLSPPRRAALESALGAGLVWKLVVSGLLLLAFYGLPRPRPDPATLPYAPVEDLGGRAPFLSYDGQRYLAIARDGYPVEVGMNSAFYPLFPALIWAAAVLTRDLFWAAMLVISFALAAACLAFTDWVRAAAPALPPLTPLLLALAFPSAFYLAAVYSEGLFLALLFGFLALYRRGSRWCLVPALFLSTARGPGIFVAGALAVLWLWTCFERRRAGDGLLVSAVGVMALGFFGVLLFGRLTTGDFGALFRGQGFYIFDNKLSNLVNPRHFFGYLFSEKMPLFAWTHGLFDRAVVVLMLALVPVVWRFKEPVLTACYLALAVLPALMGLGGGYTRFALPAFWVASVPIAAALVAWPRVVLALAAAGGGLQVFLLSRFALNQWVA